MFVRSLLRIVGHRALASHVAPRTAFSAFNTATASKFHRQPGLLASFSRAASTTQAVPHTCRYFSLSRISSRPAPTSIASRGFFSSSEGPRPSLSEVLSLTKLKVLPEPPSIVAASTFYLHVYFVFQIAYVTCCRLLNTALGLLAARLRS
jgi:hypothetical protein